MNLVEKYKSCIKDYCEKCKLPDSYPWIKRIVPLNDKIFVFKLATQQWYYNSPDSIISRNGTTKPKIQIIAYEDDKFLPISNGDIPYFDPSPYTDDQLIKRVKNLLVFI